MSGRILKFNDYTGNVSESVEPKYSLDQISDALDQIESNITEYFYCSDSNGVSLDYSEYGDDITVTPSLSADVSDYSYDYDSSLSRDVVRNLDGSDDGKKPRFPQDIIVDAINTISNNADYYVKEIDTSNGRFVTDIQHHGNDEIRISASFDDSDGGIEVADFDFNEWKSDVLQEITRSISSRIMGG